VIASTQDVITPIETAKSGAGSGYLARHVKNNRFHVNEDCGHADLLEKKDQSISMIIDFLKE
jgi:pimeloyl-ACP methyl ester carboxylesterase